MDPTDVAGECTLIALAMGKKMPAPGMEVEK